MFLRADLFAVAFFLTVCSCAAQENWTLSLDKENIKVYTRKVGYSNFKEFKAETTVQTSLNAIVALFDDSNNQKNWMHNCKKVERLKEINKFEGINYAVVTTPWPLTDRDMVIKYVISQDNTSKVITITLSGLKEYIPEKKNLVRVPSLEGAWTFRPLTNGKVHITYRLHSETGGHVPASVANLYAEELPFYTLKNLKTEVLKYKNVKVEGVLEP